MDDNETRLKAYWSRVSTSCDRLIADADRLVRWADELPDLNTEEERFREIMRRLLGRPELAALDEALRGGLGSGTARQTPDRSDQLVNEVDASFVGGLGVLTDEVRKRVRQFPETEYHPPILELISLSPAELTARFGSFTAAWDQLVLLKYETSISDHRRRRVDAWFISLIDDCNRFMRDIIGATILNVARPFALNELKATFEQNRDLPVPHPSPAQLIDLPTTEMALTDAVMSYMDRGPRHTTRFAGFFGRQLGIDLFPPDSDGFRPGILSELPPFEGNVSDTLDTLLEARRVIAHESSLMLRPNERSESAEALYSLTPKQLQLVAEYLSAVCFSFAIRLQTAMLERARSRHATLVEELRALSSGQLRVLTLELLRAERYGFAWAIGESALEVEPDPSPGTMLRLNILLARQRLGPGYVDEEEVRAFDVGTTPRYVLYKQVLLDHASQTTLIPMLERCLAEGDITPKELQYWPALDKVRRQSWWSDWISMYE